MAPRALFSAGTREDGWFPSSPYMGHVVPIDIGRTLPGPPARVLWQSVHCGTHGIGTFAFNKPGKSGFARAAAVVKTPAIASRQERPRWRAMDRIGMFLSK